MDKEKRIRTVAYWLYLLKGKKTGEDLEHWLKAEKCVAWLDEIVTALFKFAIIIFLILFIMYMCIFFILPCLGYQFTVQRTM